tara:strand:+ start:5204 stop:6073 length:870 start_codon:yes stop_codon:yes gene_type:complete
MEYPVYIVSKGRYENPLTAKFLYNDKVDFKIVIEPQEYNDYLQSIKKENILITDFSNLGLGSYPARNFAWEHSISKGFKKHWIFDDNISAIRKVNKGFKIICNSGKAMTSVEKFTNRYINVVISGFNYTTFVVPGYTDKKPFLINTKCYSGMLIKNNIPFRWRLKYNEDIDLCLQVLDKGYSTILINAFTIDKISTVAKMKGGNQDELYLDNANEKKILKAQSIEKIWPQYCKTILKYGRPHHHVYWKYFKHPLIKKKNIIEKPKQNFKLKKLKKINHTPLKEFYKKNQ